LRTKTQEVKLLTGMMNFNGMMNSYCNPPFNHINLSFS